MHRILAAVVVASLPLPAFSQSPAPPPPLDLTGDWTVEDDPAENGAVVTIRHEGPVLAGTVSNVTATFKEKPECPYVKADGDTPFPRPFYVSGPLDGRGLGTMWRCTRVEDLVRECKLAAGYTTTFKVSSFNPIRIAGTYRSEYYRQVDPDDPCKFERDASGDRDVPFTLHRPCPPVGGPLAAAAAAGPAQLYAACDGLLKQGVPSQCLEPHGCTEADCFGPGAHYIVMAQASGPGFIGYPLAVLGATGPGSTPEVPVVSVGRHRDALLLTRDTCGPVLAYLKKTKEVMERTAVFHSDLGDQVRVIQDCEQICQSLGWRTTWP
jgi:hypothetical protein